MEHDNIKDIYTSPEHYSGKQVTVCGWIKNNRVGKAFGFIDLNDGSCFRGIQVVYERDSILNYDEISKQNIGAALVVSGKIELTPNMKQPFELKAETVHIEGASTPDFPLQNKRHTPEFCGSRHI